MVQLRMLGNDLPVLDLKRSQSVLNVWYSLMEGDTAVRAMHTRLAS